MNSGSTSSAAGILVKGMMQICSCISTELSGQTLDTMSARKLIAKVDDLLPLLGPSGAPHKALMPAMESMWRLRVELTDVMQSGSTGAYEQVSNELARLEGLLLRS